MAHIKCRYSIPYCEYHNRHSRLEHDEYWWCDSNVNCDIGKYDGDTNGDLVNPTCLYCDHEHGEFEKTVKRYSYEDGRVTVGNKRFLESEIKYLEIDGRLLINEGEVQ